MDYSTFSSFDITLLFWNGILPNNFELHDIQEYTVFEQDIVCSQNLFVFKRCYDLFESVYIMASWDSLPNISYLSLKSRYLVVFMKNICSFINEEVLIRSTNAVNLYSIPILNYTDMWLCLEIYSSNFIQNVVANYKIYS